MDAPDAHLTVCLSGRRAFRCGARGRAVADWIRRFARLQPAPLAAVITVTPDRQLLFVQQHASDPVNRLLDDWGIDKGAAARKAYARLGPASLEAVAERLC
jgi:hypothetical protein